MNIASCNIWGDPALFRGRDSLRFGSFFFSAWGLTFVACNDRIDALLLLQLEHLLSILLQTNVCNFCAKQFDIVFAVMPWCGNTLGQVREAVVKVWSVASVCQINLYEETETGCRLVGICQLLTWFFHGTPDDASSSSWLCREGTNHYGGRGLGISQVVLDQRSFCQRYRIPLPCSI